MSDLLGDLLKATLAALLGAALSYLLWFRQRIEELRQAHDTWLRRERYVAYRRLWRSLATLALYSPPEDVSAETLSKLGKKLREIYFSHGQVFSSRARDVFLFLQECIEVVRDEAERPPTVPIRRCTARVDPSAYQKSREEYPKLDAACLGNLPSFLDWLSKSKAVAKGCCDSLQKTEEAGRVVGAPIFNDAFLMLQFLASSLRTIITSDLSSRRGSILETHLDSV